MPPGYSELPHLSTRSFEDEFAAFAIDEQGRAMPGYSDLSLLAKKSFETEPKAYAKDEPERAMPGYSDLSLLSKKSFENGPKAYAKDEPGRAMPGFCDLPRLSKKSFEDDLKAFAKEEQSWIPNWTDSCEKANSTALLLKGTGEDKAGELKEHLQNLEEQYAKLQIAVEEQRATTAKYNKWIAHVRNTDSIMADRINQLLDQKRRGEDKVSIAMAEISQKLDHRKQKLDALRKATSWYKELLGIRCEYSNAVKFIFTNIDKVNPDREFSFSIHHDKIVNKFSMVDCDPPIEKSGPLLDALNSSNELSQFVRSMRWEFVYLSSKQLS